MTNQKAGTPVEEKQNKVRVKKKDGTSKLFDRIGHDRQGAVKRGQMPSVRLSTLVAIEVPNKTSIDDYEFKVMIGQGAFSLVRRAIIKGTKT